MDLTRLYAFTLAATGARVNVWVFLIYLPNRWFPLAMHRSTLVRIHRPNRWQSFRRHLIELRSVVAESISCRAPYLWQMVRFLVYRAFPALVCWCVQSNVFYSAVPLPLFRNRNCYAGSAARNCPTNPEKKITQNWKTNFLDSQHCVQWIIDDERIACV